MKFVRAAIVAALALACCADVVYAQIGSAAIGQATVVHTGDLGGQAVEWVIATFGTTIGTALTALIAKLLKKAGIEANAALRDKLQDIVVNGLNLAGRELAGQLAGKGDIEVKNAIANRAIQYAQQHGADTLKALGVDPASPQAIEAIKARIETAVNDPIVPSPPALDPAATAAKP